jgi:glycosyltransferase involved in cell wall biosynthesis
VIAGTPLVSIVIPTYNRRTFLVEAVHTVLAQTCADHELIVVDEGSTDQSDTLIEGLGDPRVNLITLPHSGSPPEEAAGHSSDAQQDGAIRAELAAAIARRAGDVQSRYAVGITPRPRAGAAIVASRARLIMRVRLVTISHGQ